MSPESWTAIGVIVSAASASLSAVAIARINSTGRKVDTASGLAEEARDNAAPVANGFTRNVTASLSAIQTELREIREETAEDRKALIDHLGDHVRVYQCMPYRQRADMSPAGGASDPDDDSQRLAPTLLR